MLGKLTSAVGEAQGDLRAIDIVGMESGAIVRELTVQARDSGHAHAIVEAMRRVDGACGVLMLPIRTQGVLRRVTGVEGAAAVAGITGVTISVPDGEGVTPLPEGDRYLGFVFARGNTATHVEASLRKAQSLLDVAIESASQMVG